MRGNVAKIANFESSNDNIAAFARDHRGLRERCKAQGLPTVFVANSSFQFSAVALNLAFNANGVRSIRGHQNFQ